jgi:hypothetical protein
MSGITENLSNLSYFRVNGSSFWVHLLPEVMAARFSALTRLQRFRFRFRPLDLALSRKDDIRLCALGLSSPLSHILGSEGL